MSHLTPRRLLTVAALAATTALLVGCTSGDTGGNGGSNSGDGGSAAVVDLDAARAFIEPFQEVSEFPVSEPLAQRLPADTTVVFVDNGTTVAAIQSEALKEAAEEMGVELTIVSSGNTPLEISSTFDTIVEMKPDILLSVATDPVLFSNHLETLRANGTHVVAGSIANGEEFGFGQSVLSGRNDSILVGQIMVADMFVKTEGQVTDFVFYTVPELAFTAAVQEGVESKFEELCGECTLRIVEIPIGEMGSTAPQTISSDLQAHPETGGMLLALSQLQLGLPAAFDVAGIDVPGIGWAPTEQNLAAIERGEEYAGIGLDSRVQMWTMLDQAARELADQELSESQQFGYTVKQIVTRGNVPADYSMGWQGYPDYKERFAALWAG